MNVTIIGAGNMGRAIGNRIAAGGHSVTFVSRTPENAKTAAAEVKAQARNGSKISTANLDEVELGDVVVLDRDVDVVAGQAFDLGAKIVVPPTDIPNVGRFAMIEDPAGARFAVINIKGGE